MYGNGDYNMIKQHKQLLATCSILVLSLSLVAAPDNNVKAKSPAISNKKLTINVGSKYLLKIYNAGSKKVVWSTSRKKIATVTKKGVVKGKKAGSNNQSKSWQEKLCLQSNCC